MYRLFLLVMGTLLVFSNTTNAQSSDQQLLVEGNTAFAFDLYQAIREDLDGNLFYSPYSISAALAMTYAGADGDTAAQMADTLHFDLQQEHLHTAFANLALRLEPVEDDESFSLNIANALWGQADFGFKVDFLELLATTYGAEVNEVDFISDPEAAREAINAWIEDATEDKIQDMVPEGAIGSMTRLVLANAIYFNAAWLHTFEESATTDEPFTLLDDTEIDVPTMHQQSLFDYAVGEGYQAIVLPYANSTMAMTIILPDDFSAFEAELDAEMFQQIQAGLTSYSVQLSMPKWTFAYNLGLSQTLQEMGMTDAFNPDAADFSGMAEEPLFISDVLHKAFVSVDENGTEAAAATVVMMALASVVQADSVDLQINRPFIFAITDQTSGSVLFLGRVMDPTAE